LAESGRPGSFPDLHVGGMDRELEQWVNDQASSMGERRDFLMRDNVRKRWVRFCGAFLIHWRGMSSSCVWAINVAEPAEGPA
jgi:hypothetical protein